MLLRKLAGCSVAALAGAAMLTISVAPASAMTIGSASIEKQFASSTSVEKSAWRCFWRYGHRYCRRW
jgi:hypothetical protein